MLLLHVSASTGTLYRPPLQAPSTGHLYRHPLQAPSTGPLYRPPLQATSTRTLYRHPLQAPSTSHPPQRMSFKRNKIITIAKQVQMWSEKKAK